MSDVKCNRCGWSLRGHAVETHLPPKVLTTTSDETMIAHAEVHHLLNTGCMGSLVPDTSFVDIQRDWFMGRYGKPFSKLSPAEQAEIRRAVSR